MKLPEGGRVLAYVAVMMVLEQVAAAESLPGRVEPLLFEIWLCT